MFEPSSEPKAHVGVADGIAQQIKERILSGALVVGARLPPERELARTFNVSPIVLRQALHVLKAEGLVVIKRGATGGAFVAAPSHSMVSETLSTFLRLRGTTIEQLSEARLIIEPGVAALAAERRTDDHIATLRKNVDDSIDLSRSVVARSFDNVQFHRYLADITGNSVLIAAVNSIMDNFVVDLERARLRDSVTSTISCDHGLILEAICDCDKASARKLMCSHVANIEVNFNRKDS